MECTEQRAAADAEADVLCEVRWHGRGGQGAITSAGILALAAYRGGWQGVTSAPSFGAERRGAPVTASTRMSSAPIRIFSQITCPDIAVVLDDTLLDAAHAASGVKPGGWLIVNTTKFPEQLGLDGALRVATVDATGIARAKGLSAAGSVIVNTAMLGAVARAAGIVSMEHIEIALAEKFASPALEKNVASARMAYESTRT